MIRDIVKPGYRPVIVFGFVISAMLSCHSGNNSATDPSAKQEVDDSIHYVDESKSDNGSFDKKATLPTEEEAEKAERHKMIVMQIDSTYNAINLLDDAKKEMTDMSPDELTLAERNKKSKAIFNINIIQNELTRALDASILANLRIKTDELAGITSQLEKDVSHLQSVTIKLNRATQCIGRLTNLLALGLSKGIIKPITPRTATPDAVKATVTN